MNALGFNISSKFPTLKNCESLLDLSLFKKKIEEKFEGLVIFHGIPDDDFIVQSYGDILHETFVPAANERRCAIVIVDTVVVKRPDDCISPYIHFYSMGIPNVDKTRGQANSLEPRFQKLVDEFGTRSEMPDEEQIKRIWTEVDPFADRLALVRLFEEVLFTQKGNEEPIEFEMRNRLQPLYGGRLLTYSDVRREYYRLCEEGIFKKQLNRWQAKREVVSHQMFHHSFYALLSRPSVSRVLEDASQRVPESLIPVLKNWYPVRDELSVLLKSAVPNAILSCELSLALLRPEDPQSVPIIKKYTELYGTKIDQMTLPVTETSMQIDQEVENLIKAALAGESACRGERSSLLVLCGELGRQLAQLRELDSIGE